MRKHKPKYSKDNNFKVYGSRVNVYLPRTESTCSFDEKQEPDLQRWEDDQVWEGTEDFSETKEYNFPRNKRFPEVTTLPLSSQTKELKSVSVDVSSHSGASESRESVLQGSLEDVENKITETDLVAFSLNMGTVSTGCEKQTPRFKGVGTNGSLDGSQSGTLLDDKQRMYHSKVYNLSARTSTGNRTSKSLPFLQKPRQEKRSIHENKQTYQRKKQESKCFGAGIGVVNGRNLANSIAPEFQNLRHFLPLLTLCQCPDYDSAVIEAVRDYNDPCRGVASQMYPPY